MILFLILSAQLHIEAPVRWNLSDHEVFRCRALAVAPDGTVALIDRDANHLVILDDGGRLIKRVGQNGQGPGELQTPVEICWSRQEGVFAVMDFGNARLSKWDTSGNLASEHPLAGGLFRPSMPTRDAVFLVRNGWGRNGNNPSLIQLNLKDGATIPIWQYEQQSPTEFSTIGNAPNSPIVLYRWDPVLVFGAGSNFLAVAFTARSAFHIIDHQGKSLSPPVTVKMPRYEVSPKQLEEGVQLLPNNIQADLKRGLKKPRSWPPLRTLLVDPNDHIWVVGSSGSVTQAHGVRVFDRNGKFKGSGSIAKVPLAVTEKALYYLNGDQEDLYLEKAGFRI